MRARFVIAGRMPGYNEQLKATNKDRRKGNQMKQRETDRAAWAAIASNMPRFDCPVIVRFAWYEPNEKRDLDNVAFAKKYILDGLQRAKVIPNDNPKHVVGFTDTFGVDKANPRIEVEVVEAVWVP